MIQIKRIYDPPSQDDGHRVLVDRIWPRGVTKEAAKLDAWMKDITPSPGLRTWFGHDPARWQEFKIRYLEELQGTLQQVCIEDLRIRADDGPVTLLYAAKDRDHNHARILLEVLQRDQD